MRWVVRRTHTGGKQRREARPPRFRARATAAISAAASRHRGARATAAASAATLPLRRSSSHHRATATTSTTTSSTSSPRAAPRRRRARRRARRPPASSPRGGDAPDHVKGHARYGYGRAGRPACFRHTKPAGWRAPPLVRRSPYLRWLYYYYGSPTTGTGLSAPEPGAGQPRPTGKWAIDDDQMHQPWGARRCAR